jgi:hypothetical protein
VIWNLTQEKKIEEPQEENFSEEVSRDFDGAELEVIKDGDDSIRSKLGLNSCGSSNILIVGVKGYEAARKTYEQMSGCNRFILEIDLNKLIKPQLEGISGEYDEIFYVDDKSHLSENLSLKDRMQIFSANSTISSISKVYYIKRG